MNNEYYSNLADEYYKQLNTFFSTFILNEGTQYISYGNEDSSNRFVEVIKHNQQLSNTAYFNANLNSFIHYTSIDGLLNILNSKEIRIYNLDKLNDPTEMFYAANKLNIIYDTNKIKNFKSNYFVHSMCYYNEQFQKDDINLWRLYANEGEGVGIVYEIENLDSVWQDVFLGKVIYGNDNDEYKKLQDFVEFHKNFNIKYNNFIKDVPQFIWMLLLLHKNNIWSIENEHRLIIAFKSNHPYEKLSDNFTLAKRLFHSVYKGRAVSYITLPLSTSVSNFQKLVPPWENIPAIRITKIILGYNITINAMEQIMSLVNFISTNSFGYNIPVEITHLQNELKV